MSMDRRMSRTLLCFAHGGEGGWEAICLDFDISVQGRNFEEARALLSEAIATYIQDVMQEEPAARTRLLNRRVPFHIRLGFVVRFLISLISRGKSDDDLQAGFRLPCPV